MSNVNFEVVQTENGPVTKILNREVIRVDLLEKVAERISSINPRDFCMLWPTTCIYGHLNNILKEETGLAYSTAGMAKELGIPHNDLGEWESTLFFPPTSDPSGVRWKAKPEHAVKVIRHLIDTGEIDWSKSGLDY